jgi:16S rRNA G966 N2-methylase RsmD
MELHNKYRYRWLTDDGINIPMILDHNRNQFYDKIFKNCVQNQLCIDIGFGTGFLSMLALKHGAKHILAFEANHSRFLLGKQIISELGLQDQIELVHQKFNKNQVDIAHNRIIFHEIIANHMWDEGLYHCMNRNFTMLPSEYHFTIAVCSDSDWIAAEKDKQVQLFNEYYKTIKDPVWPDVESTESIKHLPNYISEEIVKDHKIYDHVSSLMLSNQFDFDFGVQIDKKWQQLVQHLIYNNNQALENFSTVNVTKKEQWLHLYSQCKSIGGIKIKSNIMKAEISIEGESTQTVDITDYDYIQTIIPKSLLPKKDCIIMLILKLVHNDNELILGMNNHWTGPPVHTITNVTSDLEFYMNLSNSDIRISPV